MDKLKILINLLILFIFLQSFLFSATVKKTQTVAVKVPQIVLLKKTANPKALIIQAPAIAGTLPANVYDDSTYLQYSTNISVTAKTTRRIITAKLSKAPKLGYKLKLHTPSVTIGCGSGISSANAITLSSTTAQTIVSGIGNCFTGVEPSNGAQLYYSTEINSMPYQGTDNLSVVFTLTSAS